ncbi:MAG: cyclase family protein [Deltaproteobacteria bacterium]|nr:cyclase family protein [Deltaproteobacteria bacterium]
MLDVPGALGVEWLPPTRSVRLADLRAAEKRQKVEVREGDILMISTGRDLAPRLPEGRLNPFTGGPLGAARRMPPTISTSAASPCSAATASDHMPFISIPDWPSRSIRSGSSASVCI